MKKINLLAIALIALTAFPSESYAKKKTEVKNVIYLIADGMGFGAVTSLLYTMDSETGFEQGAVIGLSETSSANNHTTDSPAGGTVLATGVRTRNGYIGLDTEGNQLTSIMRKVQAKGMKTGIVVNTVLTEATPASFYAGVKSRRHKFEIAQQFTESGVDVAIGAGLEHFAQRPDSLDLTATLIEKGYDVYLSWDAVLKTESDKFVGILPLGDVHRKDTNTDNKAGAAEGHEVCLAAQLAAADEVGQSAHLSEPTVYLEKATAKALDVLSRNNRHGYFLMIESAIIDGYGHNNDAEGMIAEMKEFDNTLRQLVAYVNDHPGTLLVVTSDHETGGTGVDYTTHEVGSSAPVKLRYSTKGHTGNVVPVFAYGTGAENFGGVMKNYEIPQKIEELIFE